MRLIMKTYSLKGLLWPRLRRFLSACRIASTGTGRSEDVVDALPGRRRLHPGEQPGEGARAHRHLTHPAGVLHADHHVTGVQGERLGPDRVAPLEHDELATLEPVARPPRERERPVPLERVAAVDGDAEGPPLRGGLGMPVDAEVER